jgi:hypothetical protein
MTTYETFASLPHAVTLLGMSGVGKTVLSRSLHHSANWYHYSADYRIGTRYLAENILDNIKFKIMHMGDRFVADLLRSDSIYINHNITVDNLAPVSTFLGMYGSADNGGLDKATFLERQDMYRCAEISSMIDVDNFINKAWSIYQCNNFINDASGSLCEIVDSNDPNDPVIKALRGETLIIYIKANEIYEEALKKRAHSSPKPLFYNPDFITPRLAEQPDDGFGVDPVEFARPLFPELLNFRKPRYEQIANDYGFTIEADQLFDEADSEGDDPVSGRFMEKLYNMVIDQAGRAPHIADNLAMYLQACEKRKDARNLDR